ncbi:Small proline-rich protein 3 [Camelus dromedarius]|uniref:Small proline-rich protein 3 n=3 Tax=Camelus TaxID=9836 RepID=A0A5N4CMX1_CAMDR|nr:Small proline-rich protein 3 [Camelus dromedarius]
MVEGYSDKQSWPETPNQTREARQLELLCIPGTYNPSENMIHRSSLLGSMSSYQQKQPCNPPPQPQEQQVKQPCQPPPPQEPFVPITEEPCRPKAPQPGSTKVPEPSHLTIVEPYDTKNPKPVYPTVPQPGKPDVAEPCPPPVIPDTTQKKTGQK